MTKTKSFILLVEVLCKFSIWLISCTLITNGLHCWDHAYSIIFTVNALLNLLQYTQSKHFHNDICCKETRISYNIGHEHVRLLDVSPSTECSPRLTHTWYVTHCLPIFTWFHCFLQVQYLTTCSFIICFLLRENVKTFHKTTWMYTKHFVTIFN